MATKYCCRNEGKLILRAFIARSPDGSTVLFRYYLLGGDTAALSGLFGRLCHALLVFTARRLAKRGISRRRVSVCLCVCVCVCLSHPGIVSKRLNVGSRK